MNYITVTDTDYCWKIKKNSVTSRKMIANLRKTFSRNTLYQTKIKYIYNYTHLEPKLSFYVKEIIKMCFCKDICYCFKIMYLYNHIHKIIKKNS